MVQLEKYLNVRFSTRNLTDVEFHSIVDDLAESIQSVDYKTYYSDDKLNKDWNDLKKWKSFETNINSTSRIGMKLCEHFFPNFYEIEDNKGRSFSNSWTKENLKKILAWNRKSHSTPYLSELKRGIYFCCGLTKSTMYRPQMAKLLCMNHKPNVVLDPCAGWGGRMMGVVSSGAKYIAFEPNTETYNNLQRLVQFLNIQDQVTLICDDALKMDQYDIPKVDMVLTSPPYFDVEVYTKESTQSITNITNYETWVNEFLEPLVIKAVSHLNTDGVSCWNVGKVANKNMADDIKRIHDKLNFKKINTFSVVSSKRQALQNESKNQKNFDNTEVFKNEQSI